MPQGNQYICGLAFRHEFLLAIALTRLIKQRQNEFVYILQGSFEEVIAKQGYYTWFKVEKGRYTRQWEQAIQLAKYFGAEVTG